MMLTKQDIQKNVADTIDDLFEFDHVHCADCNTNGVFKLNKILSCENCGWYIILNGKGKIIQGKCMDDLFTKDLSKL